MLPSQSVFVLKLIQSKFRTIVYIGKIDFFDLWLESKIKKIN